MALVAAFALASAASGGTSLAACGEEAPGGLCGIVDVPLDRDAPGAETIPIAFELYPRRDQSAPSLGTVIVVQGGPGGSSTELRFFYDFFGPLFDQRDLLLVDVRGTGKSDAIDCPELQEAFDVTLEMISGCAVALGDAADLYTTVDAVEDIDDVRAALGIQKLDFYGVSYGTQIGQVYAVRHGDRLRTLVLDSAYPITQRTDLWDFDRVTGRALLSSVSRLCERSYLCGQVGGDVDQRMRSLINRLRSQPVTGESVGPLSPEPVRVTVDEAELIKIVSGYGYEPGQVEIDGAHAALRRGDEVPLLRLGAEMVSFPAGPATSISIGTYFAVSCTETSYPWDVSDPQDVRIAKWEAAFDAIPDGTFAPFAVPAWREAAGDGWVGLLSTACVAWPAPNRAVPQLVPPGAARTSAPTLVMNGDLDKVTPTEAAVGVAAGFRNGTYVEFANAGHGVAFSGPCAMGVLMTFVETMDPGDTSCAADPPPFYGYTTFPLVAADGIRPVEQASGDHSTKRDRKAVAALADTILDALGHYPNGVGLRGGFVSPFPEYIEETDSLRLSLDGARFVTDVAVTGFVDFSFQTGDFTGKLRIRGSGTASGEVRYFDPADPAAPIEIRGKIGGRKIALDLPDVT
ncbi:MAG: alpha/beta fold hydrolase [Gaiellales bacterium]